MSFRDWAHRAADWSADYLERVRSFPVRAQTRPGAIHAALPASPPEAGEPMDAIFADLDRLILPGMTHWQHPRFFAYFPANASPPSVVAEYVTAAMAAQCMLWQTSPAATELEARMMDWLRQMIALPEGFAGVIQDSATSATFAAILTAREKALGGTANAHGLAGGPTLRVYASAQTHSSVDKAVRMAGIGGDNLVKVPTSGSAWGIDVAALERALVEDRAAGRLPCAVVACLGGTSIGACDDIAAVAEVARRHGLYLHVDAAWAGAAMICPEFRHLMRGAEEADSVVFNPHKWLFTNFDCTAHFVRDPAALTGALGLRPAYLRTLGRGEGEVAGVTDYNEWSVPLGRRFRALKLWFVIRSYGVEALRGKIRNHVAWSRELAERLAADPDFEIVTPPVLSLFSFRAVPARLRGAKPAEIDAFNEALLTRVNDDGRIYLTQTVHEGRFVIRFQAGQTETTREDVMMAGDVLRELATEFAATGFRSAEETV
ncbi:aminotransferase class I/II-fold pyridoxal phosphate-dependent enzyme [Alsobacter sp. SYSU M60028]|uniref:Aminotransferase class I/II-fold pyridoxal phosphate-dependent enzyme n=1 Tax=Alsobacter ponti TaxID=2962936 RepID=A0ABT1LHX3_9HYPH|nr:aminotransferase class I/II-fold pyridoxal phosphate-dependent enzyme [Alsobacter ponti]MCP8940723.1 aminotransferase class I/II-fold pyridoxal phosphate-dependent enzyme [Alsobacter ponti]